MGFFRGSLKLPHTATKCRQPPGLTRCLTADVCCLVFVVQWRALTYSSHQSIKTDLFLWLVLIDHEGRHFTDGSLLGKTKDHSAVLITRTRRWWGVRGEQSTAFLRFLSGFYSLGGGAFTEHFGALWVQRKLQFCPIDKHWLINCAVLFFSASYLEIWNQLAQFTGNKETFVKLEKIQVWDVLTSWWKNLTPYSWNLLWLWTTGEIHHTTVGWVPYFTHTSS